jgi:5-aminolevulinate synthase
MGRGAAASRSARGWPFGVVGGYIAASNALCDFVRSFASGFIFTTSLPPAVAAGARASVTHLKRSQMERAHQRRNVAKVRAMLDDAGIPHLVNQSHIIPVMIKDPVKCRFISDILLDDFGIYVQPINYPTVPKGTERLRITPSPVHTDADMGDLVSALSMLWRRCALARAAA